MLMDLQIETQEGNPCPPMYRGGMGKYMVKSVKSKRSGVLAACHKIFKMDIVLPSILMDLQILTQRGNPCPPCIGGAWVNRWSKVSNPREVVGWLHVTRFAK